MSVWLVNIKALDEDTGETGIVHVEVPSEGAARALITDLIQDVGHDVDPGDFRIIEVPDNWDCVGHGDGAMCALPPVGFDTVPRYVN
jgi:hypothetical protein